MLGKVLSQGMFVPNINKLVGTNAKAAANAKGDANANDWMTT